MSIVDSHIKFFLSSSQNKYKPNNSNREKILLMEPTLTLGIGLVSKLILIFVKIKRVNCREFGTDRGGEGKV